MRKLMIFFLLASAAAPALAAPDDADIDRPRRVDRSEARAARAERPDAGLRPERIAPGDRPQWNGGERSARVEHDLSRGRPEEGREQRRSWAAEDRASVSAGVPNDGNDGVRNWRRRDRGVDTKAEARPDSPRNGGRRPSERAAADSSLHGAFERSFGDRDHRRADRQPRHERWNEHVRERLAVSSVPREGTQPPPRADRNNRSLSSQWSRSWRDDHRYDWRGQRQRHRSLFHIGFYYDPFGWSYQRYNVGWRMWPSYYVRNYWLNDPWMYRLPPAYPGTQWIRYHDDAILVDTWTGEVVDVIYDFFW
jgi:hypothetical protein